MRSTSCVKDDQFYLELVEKLGHDVLGVIRLHSDKSFLVRTRQGFRQLLSAYIMKS